MRHNFNKMKLIPAIIQDYYSNEVLMLAYVDEESFKCMLEKKETYFYSRSRKKLWHKGETSGNIQKIKKIYLDCDMDTLLIIVEQVNVACHTGNRSCFFNEVANYCIEDASNINILDDVYRMIEDRDKNPQRGSYTNYLLDEGIDKICKKVGEEATETVIAAKNNNKNDLIGEICDLLYHLEVLMYNKRVHLEDVRRILIERHKKEGNKKIQNKKGDY